MITGRKLLFGLILACSAIITGCLSGSSSVNSWQSFAGTGVLTGNVTASGTIQPGNSSRFDLRGMFNVGGAAIWLQDHPEIRTISAGDGSFVLENVPFGVNRVVANIKANDNKVYKTRSEPIEMTQEAPNQEIGQLAVEFANNRVRIILRDADGNSVSNAVLTLWGETCELDGDGIYLSPPLPDSELIEEILIVSADGLDTGSIIAPFSPNGESVIFSTLTTPDARNKAPSVWLTTVKESADKINPGEIVKLWAVYLDSNLEDLDNISVTWELTGGTLASGSSPIPEDHKRRIPNVDWSVSRVVSVEWAAPSMPANYKVQVSVTDTGGLSGHAQHPLNVHLSDTDPAPPLPANRPPSAYIVASSTVLTGQPLPLRVIASDPDLDILSYAWSVSPAGGSFSSTKAESVVWTAPSASGVYEIRCRVTEIGEAPLSVEATFNVIVQEDPIIVRPGMIAGHVLDAQTRLPIPQAVVAISGTNIYRIADDTGYFEFVNLAAGNYTLIATRNGYQARTYSGIVVPAL
ncbi:MAG: hypothetical protein CVV42_17385 [Candidatus Riflebacteria bacterium HGW-Riflebacteria-2]|jgi:hypothetical protein|nr:MAG: hypothetical protein CVV42_17385 [Candidatus Riflebacteria bacterium HGW-Riflebacteria-2]